MSEGNKNIIESLNPNIGKIEVLRNWTNQTHIEKKSNSNFLSNLKINNKKFFSTAEQWAKLRIFSI